eukprot:scaffold3320_cov186-Ochromonas_danica.AAC.1
MFCRMITRSCGGSFEHQEETGAMHFTFPCSVSDSKLIQFLNAKVADSVATNARRTIFYSSRALEKMRQEESSSSSSGQYSNDKEDESGITYDSIGGVDRIGVKDSHQHHQHITWWFVLVRCFLCLQFYNAS